MALCSSAETIVGRLSAHAQRMPGGVAFRFLREDGGNDALTFGELAERVVRLAARLAELAHPGDRALLLYPPGLEFVEAFLACLAAGVIAVPAFSPRKNRSAERLLAIAKDAAPRLVLTSSQALAAVEASGLAESNRSTILATDAVELGSSGETATNELVRHPVAFLQYTSGSTASPRGVVVTHESLCFNERQIQASFGHTADSVMVSWLPVFHDMGLVGGILQPLFVGFPSILLSPAAFVREPVRWLKAVTDYRGTTTGAPNFAYEHCTRLITEEQKATLDLSSLRIAYNGAEPVREETLARFTAAFARCGFRQEMFFPCYGLAEATLFVSGGPAGRPPSVLSLDSASLERDHVVRASRGAVGVRNVVSCGEVAEGTSVRVVDPQTTVECARANVGEIWLASGSVCAGYWNRPAETGVTFPMVQCDNSRRTFVRTGDLGFVEGGNLFITGRLKDVIILRGRKIYPQDVEAVVEREAPFVPANGTAAFAMPTDGDLQLGVVLEGDRAVALAAKRAPHDLGRLFTALQAAVVREFDIRLSHAFIVPPGALPRTSSGKVRRQDCLRQMREGQLSAILAWRAGAEVVQPESPSSDPE